MGLKSWEHTMARLINAPHLADQPHEPYSDLIILAGRKAWQAWNKGKGEEWLLLFELVYGLKPTEKPVILGDKQLDNITGIKLAEPEQQTIKLFQYGELTAAQITAICLNLADNTQVKAVELYDNSAQLKEDLSAYIQRLRSEDRSIANLVVEPAKIKDKSPFSEKAQSFRQWLNLDLALQRGSREIYHYDGKIWAQLDSEDLEEKAVQFFNDSDLGYSIRSIESLIGTLKAQLPRMGDQSSGLLAFNDGVLNRNTLVFEASSREHWLTSLIPVNYQNQAQNTPHFDKWLDFVSEGNADKKHNILAALYAILTNRYNWQMFFEITGVGGSGKSIFAQIATMLAGEENTDTARLAILTNLEGESLTKIKP